MSTRARAVACALVALWTVVAFGCNGETGGIGMGVPSSGARWGGGNSGPGVFVAGGPVYR